ncbi:MAG: T9SS type A sorting domain-containing protein, partial [Bacteroidia bacterium]
LIKAISPYYSVSSVALNTDAELILDPAISSDLGNMDLSGSQFTISAQNAADILVNNAASNLDYVGYYGYGAALSGNIKQSYYPFMYAHGNYWKSGNPCSEGTDYPNFSDPNGQFNDYTAWWNPNHSIDGTGYLTTAPNIDYVDACYSERAGYNNQIIHSGNTNNNQDRNVYGKTGNTHTTPLFEKADSVPFLNGHNLKYAVKSIFADDIDTTLTGMNAQLNSHEQLLKHNFGSFTNKAKPVVNLVYNRMQQTIGIGMKHGLIQRSSTSAQLNQLINVQDTLLNRTPLNDSNARFTLIKDKALVLRLANRRSDALILLAQAHSLSDSIDKRFIEKWQCFIQKEIMLHDSLITKKQFLTLVKQCGVPDSIYRYGKRSTNENGLNDVKEVASVAATNLDIKLYPNPAYDNLNIAINHIENETNITIQIVDIVGRVMQIQTSQIITGQDQLNINVPINLSSGTYFVKLDGTNIHETKRFAVMK